MGDVTTATLTPEEGGVCRPDAHRSIGAVSRVAADDQCEQSDDHPEGFGTGRDLVRQGENSRWRARFRGDGDPRQGNPTDILRPRSGEPIAAEENSWNPMDRRDSQ